MADLIDFKHANKDIWNSSIDALTRSLIVSLGLRLGCISHPFMECGHTPYIEKPSEFNNVFHKQLGLLAP